MTIYFKCRGSGVWQFCNKKFSNIKKVIFHHGIVTKSIVSGVNRLNFIILCVCYYNGLTQKPHDHLFQKSWQRGLAVLQQKMLQIQKSDISPRHCNQIRCQCGKLFTFHHIMCMLL